jgi:hypothetical protein
VPDQNVKTVFSEMHDVHAAALYALHRDMDPSGD